MSGTEPTFRIDPIDPSQVEARFSALIDRLEPFLQAGDVTTLRALVADGDYATAYALLDGITNDGKVSVDTATLVELVLLGQAIRAS
jgi:hypothetical protein